MKTSNLQPILDAVRNIEKKELADALKKHGGSFTFPDDAAHPGIEFSDQFKGPKSADVDKLELLPSGVIFVSVTDNDGDSYHITTADDIYPGFLSAITAALPPTPLPPTTGGAYPTV